MFSHYLKIPTGPQPALTFGNIMHQCARRYFELRRQGPVKFEQLQAHFEQIWKGAGFEDDYQEQAYKKAGLEQLRVFVSRHETVTISSPCRRGALHPRPGRRGPGRTHRPD